MVTGSTVFVPSFASPTTVYQFNGVSWSAYPVGGTSTQWLATNSVLATAGQTVFPIGATPKTGSAVELFKNGRQIPAEGVTWSGTNVTFTPANLATVIAGSSTAANWAYSATDYFSIRYVQ